MKRVVVVGSGGSGKSTFSRQLCVRTGLPVVHLDQLYWRSGWVSTPKDEWETIVRREIEKPEWIMDGNFGGTREMRMHAADTVIFLDLSRWVCLLRILKRTVKHYGRNRPDMAGGCDERFDPEFLSWIWNYPNRSRFKLLAEMEKLPDKKIIVLKTKSEVEKFLERVDQ